MKLQHRITGTILAIAFATTTALPAATIAQLKNPPKAVAKVPSAPTAPRIPVAPRIVNVPKVPAVKVPVVKVPVSPRIVSAPKIPVVKAAPKIPAAPRIVSTPKVPVVKTPVKVAVATRIPAVKTPATISPKAPVAVSRPVNGPKLNPKDIRKVINESLKPTLITRTPDFATLPTRSLPGSSKPNLKPTSPGTPSLDGTPGTATPTIGPRPIPALGDDLTTKPSFDNGFGTRPQLTQADLGNALNLNPMKGHQPGAASGGLLGGTIPGHNGNPFAGGVPKGGAAGSEMVSVDGWDVLVGTVTFVAGALGAAEVAVGAGGVAVVKQAYEWGDASAYGNADAVFNAIESHEDPTKPENEAHLRLEQIKKEAAAKEAKDAEKKNEPTPSTPSASTPDPENGHTGNHTFGVAVGQQIKQGKSGRKGSVGGGADVMPVNESYTGGAARIPGAAVPQNKNGMVGNPGQQGGPENGGVTPPTNSNDQGNVTNPNPTDN